MMGRWRYWRLKTKLLFLTLFTSALGITLVCASLIFVENQNYRCLLYTSDAADE